MPVSDSEYRAALTRAGDASAAEAVACRERDEARCDLRRTAAALLEARAVIAAACAALGASATGDLAADVAREVAAHGATHGAYQSALAGRDKAKRALASEEAERAAAEATLRETQHALARVTADGDAALERGVRIGLERAAQRMESRATSEERHADTDPLSRGAMCALRQEAMHVRDLGCDAASIAARIEAAPPVEVSDAEHARDVAMLCEMRGRAPEPKVGDRVRCRVGDVIDRTGMITDVDADDPGLPYRVEYDEGGSIWLRADEIEPTPVEAAAEPPHRVNDVWRDHMGDERTVRSVSWGDDEPARVAFLHGGAGRVEWLLANGWTRVRCAAVDDVGGARE